MCIFKDCSVCNLDTCQKDFTRTRPTVLRIQGISSYEKVSSAPHTFQSKLTASLQFPCQSNCNLGVGEKITHTHQFPFIQFISAKTHGQDRYAISTQAPPTALIFSSACRLKNLALTITGCLGSLPLPRTL